MGMLQWLAGRLGSAEEMTQQLPQNIHLPAPSLEELQTLEEQLESRDNRSTLVCVFDGVGVETGLT